MESAGKTSQTQGQDTVLDPADELIGEQQNRLDRELARAEVEEILQTGAQQFHHHDIVVAFHAETIVDKLLHRKGPSNIPLAISMASPVLAKVTQGRLQLSSLIRGHDWELEEG